MSEGVRVCVGVVDVDARARACACARVGLFSMPRAVAILSAFSLAHRIFRHYVINGYQR